MQGSLCRQFGALSFTLFLYLLVARTVQAGPGCACSGCSSEPARTSPSTKLAEPRLAGQAPLTSRPPHYGQISKGSYQSFEVVYLPYETRVYIFGPTDRPATCQAVRGQITMQVKGNPTLFRYPLKYLPPIPGSSEGDCLQAQVDVTRVRDGDIQVTVELSDLPYDRQEPNAQFSQIFALTPVPLTVTRIPITVADQEEVAAQRICPVTNQPLGIQGGVIKALVRQQPMYLCSEACLEEVQEDPDLYLRRVAQANQIQHAAYSPPVIRAEQASADDRAAIESQRFCPVMRQPLGVRGTPWKVLVEGQPVFVCCRDCIGRVEAEPAPYLAEARRLRGW